MGDKKYENYRLVRLVEAARSLKNSTEFHSTQITVYSAVQCLVGPFWFPDKSQTCLAFKQSTI